MSQVMTRAKRWIPQESEKVLLFTERDYDILYALYKYQLFTTHQLEEIHQGSKQKTQRRLRELFNAGYIRKFDTKVDLTTPGTEPDVYALTDQGAKWLAHHRSDIARLNKRYNENNARRTIATIPHALMVSDIMMRFELACCC
jgi:DNA-binding PadR family transcriptional regulator